MMSLRSATSAGLLVLCCSVPAVAADAWVAEWDMPNGLAELRQGNFKKPCAAALRPRWLKAPTRDRAYTFLSSMTFWWKHLANPYRRTQVS